MERTLILLKPDTVERQLVGTLLNRFEQKGLKIVAMRMLQFTPELAQRHYADHVDKPFYPGLEAYITSGPAVAAILEGPEAIAVVRRMIGQTNGIEASAGTIRGDYALSSQRNLVHASDSSAAADREMAIFFGSDWKPFIQFAQSRSS
jgi:nucleoside-diphosphate kinase